MVTLFLHRFPIVLSRKRNLKIKIAGRNHKKGGKWGIWWEGNSQRQSGWWQPFGGEGSRQNWELMGRKKGVLLRMHLACWLTHSRC